MDTITLLEIVDAYRGSVRRSVFIALVLAVALLGGYTLQANADATWTDRMRVDYPAQDRSQIFINCFSVRDPGYVGVNCTAEAFFLTPMYVADEPTPLNAGVVVTAFDPDHVYLVDEPCVLTEQSPSYDGGTFYAVTCGDDIFNNGFTQ
jgi:hypothetical protein